ncbi:MAG TPA: hypothetical protein VFB74_22485 [Kribbellaceae bacterium]|nr:hypothetical protein [Kribbellaceae bacterium]
MGEAFIKVTTYFPYPMKIWVNAHEWAKRQATAAGIGFTALSNGFASCDDPAALQAICDRFGPGAIRVFAERWWARLPLPLTPADRAAGYWWDLSMRQVEFSRTIVFTAPRHARVFFETLISDNLDLGRPDHIEVIFGRRISRRRRPTKRSGKPTHPTPEVFKTAIDRANQGVTVNIFFKHSRAKQYLKDGRAMRIETVVNDTTDLGVLRRLEHFDELSGKARAINHRIVEAERVGQGAVLASPAFERIAHPSVEDGRRAPALRFGDPRVQALAGALANTLTAAVGITNRSLRALMPALLGAHYTTSQASYDLTRLRAKGLIERLPGRNLYRLTPTANGSRSSTPSCTTGCCDPCWPPTDHPHPSSSAKPCAPSTDISTSTSTWPESAQLETFLAQDWRSPSPSRASRRTNGQVVALALHDVGGKVGRRVGRRVRRKEDRVPYEDATDHRVLAGAHRLPPVVTDPCPHLLKAGGAVALAEQLPSLGRPQSRESAVEPAANHPVVRVMSLEEEGLAWREHPELTPAAGPPEVDLIHVRAGGQVPIPVAIGDANIRPHAA